MTPAEWILENKTFLPYGRKVKLGTDVYRIESHKNGFYKLKRVEGKYCGNDESLFQVMSDHKIFIEGELVPLIDRIVNVKYF